MNSIKGQFFDFAIFQNWHQDPLYRKSLLTFTLFAISIPMVYVVYTGHIWEDYMITFKQSENLAEGRGLVYHEGERVHAFTSVINTVLPAFFHWLFKPDDHYLALWLYRIASILFFAINSLVLFRFLYYQRTPSLAPLLFFGGFVLCEIKAIAFMGNGQEAGFMIGFLAPSLLFAYRGINPCWLPTGIYWAGLMYTRPDSPFYIAILSLACLLFSPLGFRENLKGIGKAAIVCTILYLPWFIFAWQYYGSPVPHTITAKLSLPYSVKSGPTDIILGIFSNIFKNISHIFGPIYPWFGSWPSWVSFFGIVTSLICFALVIIPTDRFVRMTAFCFTLLFAYFAIFHGASGWIAPWYLPPLAFLGMTALSQGLFTVTQKWKNNTAKPLLLAPSIVVQLCISWIFINSMVQIKLQQKYIEDGTRTVIGKWLKENTQTGDTVFLECLGYIGYFSECKMLDFPGMASPSIVKIRKEHNVDFGGVIPIAKPTWLVLRASEAAEVMPIKEIADKYSPKITFDTTPLLVPYKDIPGINYLLLDSRWIIFKRKE